MRTLLESGPVTVGGQQTSKPFEFDVRNEEENKFLRFIALWRDGEPLGGEAPTFLIRASDGLFTSVRPDSGEVTIVDSSDNEVGSVHCEREPNDIFLLTITPSGENLNPWKIRITNNDSESLRFLGFCSDIKEKTLQPWMVLGRANQFAFIGDNEQKTEQEVEVRNWGTKPLTFQEGSGTQLGGEGSPFTLAKLPKHHPVKPHNVGILTIEARNVQRSVNLPHTFKCDDPVSAHAKLDLSLSFTRPLAPPPPRNPCRFCSCVDFVGTGIDCARDGCGHSHLAHLALGPDDLPPGGPIR